MNRQFFIVIFALFVTVSKSYSQNGLQEPEWFSFNWVSFTFQERVIEKAAMMIPVTIDDIPQKFKMQFDLGSGKTMLYKKPLKHFLEEYPLLKNKISKNRVKNVDLQFGKVLFKDTDVTLTNFGDNLSAASINSETEILIGTIGADLFKNKILIIDYKLNRLAIVNTLSLEYQNASFMKFKKAVAFGLIKIPFLIDGKKKYLLFDTGSSLMSLFTTQKNAVKIGGNEIVDFITGSSWGKIDSIYGYETIVPVTFGDRKMEKSIVYHMDSNRYDLTFKVLNVWGITGNA